MRDSSPPYGGFVLGCSTRLLRGIGRRKGAWIVPLSRRLGYLIIGVRSRCGRILAIQIDGKSAYGAICYYADVRAQSLPLRGLFIVKVVEEAARVRFCGTIRERSWSRVVIVEPLTLIIGQ